MPDGFEERSEQPTARRIEHARQRGQVAYSRDLSGAVILLAATIGFHLFGEQMLGDSAGILRYCLQSPWLDLDVDRFRVEMGRTVLRTALAVLSWLMLVLAAALTISLFQTGGLLVATERPFLDWGRLNPASGLRRIFSVRGLVRTALDVAKVLLIGLVGLLFFLSQVQPLASLVEMPFPEVSVYAFSRSLILAYEMTAVILALALADFVYQRFQYRRELRMTRQEMRQELKDIEGEPQIKHRRRQIQLRLARQRMIQRVPEAQVVITNPQELAVALRYEPEEMDAPLVVAKGAGLLAQRIRELAREHRIPIIENPSLARLLFRKADVDRVIPEESFVVVAQILAYVYQISGKKLPPRAA